MPNSHYTAQVGITGDPDIIAAAWAGFMDALGTGGAMAEAPSLVSQSPLAAPTYYAPGVGQDVQVTAPIFDMDDLIDYSLRYSDDNGATWTRTSDAATGAQMIVPNGYNSGRIFSIFTGELAGVSTDPLP